MACIIFPYLITVDIFSSFFCSQYFSQNLAFENKPTLRNIHLSKSFLNSYHIFQLWHTVCRPCLWINQGITFCVCNYSPKMPHVSFCFWLIFASIKYCTLLLHKGKGVLIKKLFDKIDQRDLSALTCLLMVGTQSQKDDD